MTGIRSAEVVSYAGASLFVGFVVWTVSANLASAATIAVGMFIVAFLGIVWRARHKPAADGN